MSTAFRRSAKNLLLELQVGTDPVITLTGLSINGSAANEFSWSVTPNVTTTLQHGDDFTTLSPMESMSFEGSVTLYYSADATSIASQLEDIFTNQHLPAPNVTQDEITLTWYPEGNYTGKNKYEVTNTTLKDPNFTVPLTDTMTITFGVEGGIYTKTEIV